MAAFDATARDHGLPGRRLLQCGLLFAALACTPVPFATIAAQAENGSAQPTADPFARDAAQAGATSGPAHTTSAPATAVATRPVVDQAGMDTFLDRLMLAESGGRDNAKNPRSTALGAFQFLETTFLDVARRHFAAEVAALTSAQILALRTDRAFARRAAEAFTQDNIAHLAGAGIPATFASLRLAYLVGPAGTLRLFRAEATSPVIGILGAPVVQANPFMAGMTVRDLLAWSERNISGSGTPLLASAPPGSAMAAAASRDAAPPLPKRGNTATPSLPIVPVKADATPAKPPRPAVKAQCNIALASCRKWVALAEGRVARRAAAAAPAPRRGVR